MTWLWITLGIVAGLGLLVLVPGLVMMRKLPALSKPLKDEEVEVCRRIVAERRGYPWVCRWAVKHKACPCLPCRKLDAAKAP